MSVPAKIPTPAPCMAPTTVSSLAKTFLLSAQSSAVLVLRKGIGLGIPTGHDVARYVFQARIATEGSVVGECRTAQNRERRALPSLVLFQFREDGFRFLLAIAVEGQLHPLAMLGSLVTNTGRPPSLDSR